MTLMPAQLPSYDPRALLPTNPELEPRGALGLALRGTLHLGFQARLCRTLNFGTEEGNGNSSILSWRVRRTEKPGRLHTVQGIQRVGHDLATKPPPPDFGATNHRQASHPPPQPQDPRLCSFPESARRKAARSQSRRDSCPRRDLRRGPCRSSRAQLCSDSTLPTGPTAPAPAPVPGRLPSTRGALPSPWGPSAGPTSRVFDLSPIPAHFTRGSSLLPALRPRPRPLALGHAH